MSESSVVLLLVAPMRLTAAFATFLVTVALTTPQDVVGVQSRELALASLTETSHFDEALVKSNFRAEVETRDEGQVAVVDGVPQLPLLKEFRSM